MHDPFARSAGTDGRDAGAPDRDQRPHERGQVRCGRASAGGRRGGGGGGGGGGGARARARARRAPPRAARLARLRRVGALGRWQRRRHGGGGGVPVIVIEVLDGGPGLRGATEARLFSDFAGATTPSGAAQGGTNRGVGSSGLGLPICARLARLLGGRLHVRERGGGQRGVSFVLVLPWVLPPRRRRRRRRVIIAAAAGRRRGLPRRRRACPAAAAPCRRRAGGPLSRPALRPL
jgi:hypothetical protein